MNKVKPKSAAVENEFWRNQGPAEVKPVNDVRRRQMLQMTEIGREILRQRDAGNQRPAAVKRMSEERRRLLGLTELGRVALQQQGEGSQDGEDLEDSEMSERRRELLEKTHLGRMALQLQAERRKRGASGRK